MSTKISQRELRNNSGKVLRRAAAGETMTITNRGAPVAELRPAVRTRSISRYEMVRDLKNMPNIDAKQFRKDVDAIVDQSTDYRW
jgi:prevent-host-death family protein